MASPTPVPFGSPQAVVRYSSVLATDVVKQSYWTSKMMAPGIESRKPVMVLNDLANSAGDKITYDLCAQLRQEPILGDDVAEGREEKLSLYTDSIYIDQVRCPVSAGGAMSQQRTVHDLRQIALTKSKEWWARYIDEILFMYASGARGVTTDFITRSSFTGFANNPFSAPDLSHYMAVNQSNPASLAVAKSSMQAQASDKMSLTMIDRVKARAATMGGGTDGVPSMVPVETDSGTMYVAVVHEWSAYDMRQNTSTGQWADLQKALVTNAGVNTPLFKGGLGIYNDVLLQPHRNVIRFSDYGAGSNVPAARNLFLGAQALCVAFGGGSTGFRMQWYEGKRDGDNQRIIHTKCIFGVKKTNFTIPTASGNVAYDFGVIAMDAYCANPG